jgi:hypothetical protein
MSAFISSKGVKVLIINKGILDMYLSTVVYVYVVYSIFIVLLMFLLSV